MKRLTLTVALAVPLLALAAAPPPTGDAAVKRTESFIKTLMLVKSSDTGPLPKADQDANQKIFTELDGFFDWDYLLSEPVKPRIDKFSAAEKEEFTRKFREVLRLVAYPDSGGFFRKSKYKVTPAKEEGGMWVVGIEAKRDDIETRIDLHFKTFGDQLKLHDVSFDGDSLVKDYQNQMVRIIDKGEKEGVKQLISKIDKRKADLEKPKK